MTHIYYIQLIDGDSAWTYGPRGGRISRGLALNAVWTAIQCAETLSVTDQRPPTAEGFDGVPTIFNPAYVKSVTAFPVPA